LQNELLLLSSHLVDHGGVCLPNNETTLVDIPNPCSVHTEAEHYHVGTGVVNGEENSTRIEAGSEHDSAQVYHRMEGQIHPFSRPKSALDHMPALSPIGEPESTLDRASALTPR
jgi:hypothetical protein